MQSLADVFRSARIPIRTRSNGLTEKHKVVLCYGLRLLEEFGLTARYGIAYNKERINCAKCYAAKGRRQGCIALSAYFVELNSYELILEVLLHEIAHALVGNKHGHDEVWQAKAQALGLAGNRYVDCIIPPAVYRAACKCGRTYGRYRRPQKRKVPSCVRCKHPLYFMKA